MTLDEALRVALKSLKQREHYQVVEVEVIEPANKQDMTVSVKPKIHGTNLYKVRLKAAHDEQSGVEMIPSYGSTALVAIAHDNDSEPFITKTSRLERARLSVGAYEVRIEEGMLTLNKRKDTKGLASGPTGNLTGLPPSDYNEEDLQLELKMSDGVIKIKNSVTAQEGDTMEYTATLDESGIKLEDGQREVLLNDQLIKLQDGTRRIILDTAGEAIEINDGVHEILMNDEGISIRAGEDHVVLEGGEVHLNGTGFEGLVKAPELKTQIDKNTKAIQGIIDAIKNGKPTPDQSGAGLHTSIIAGLTTITQFADLSNIQNEKVKHG